MGESNGAGKGDTYRHVNRKKYEENYERVYGKPDMSRWTCQGNTGVCIGSDCAICKYGVKDESN